MYKITDLEGGLSTLDGFYFDSVNVGMRPDASQGDVAFIRSETPCDVAAVFTANRFQAAPLRHYQRYPKGFKTDFLLINAKNANAMTGEAGIDDIDTIFDALKERISITHPIMSSTGVIGYRLPTDRIVSAFDRLDFSARDSDATARAILTTDTFKKEVACEVTVPGGGSFRIAAIAKGAGMIDPAMATMLAFILTDADVPRDEMESLLREGADRSFNRISVDGDTSTNDTALLLTNHASGVYHRDAFREGLRYVMFELAMMILRDGEGSTKVVAFEVKGAASTDDARKAAVALSNSLLVKTALFGEDPNWGRIASTIGSAGIACDEESLRIHYDDALIYAPEQRELDREREEIAYRVMQQDTFTVTCDLGVGKESYTAYGCDLSYDYVKINAEYRT